MIHDVVSPRARSHLELSFSRGRRVKVAQHVLQDVGDGQEGFERSAVDNGPRRGVREQSLGEQLGSRHVWPH